LSVCSSWEKITKFFQRSIEKREIIIIKEDKSRVEKRKEEKGKEKKRKWKEEEELK
jgi:hypothetical protein